MQSTIKGRIMDHQRILNAYLMRLMPSDIEAINEANKKWLHATMNLNNDAQMKAKAGFYGLVANAFQNLIEHDVNYIEQVINEETRGEQ